MSFLRTLQADLRERQILPAVVVLAALAVLIPIVASVALSHYSVTPPPPVTPPHVSLPKGIRPPAQELAVLNSVPMPATITRGGREPNPFRVNTGGGVAGGASQVTAPTSPVRSPAKPPTTTAHHVRSTTPRRHVKTAPATKTPPVVKTAPKTAPPSSKGAPKHTSSKPTSTPHKPSSTTQSPPVTVTPTTGPATLSSTQAYTVNVATRDAKGTHALTDLVRLAPLPTAETPEVIYLGVVKGGKKAAFLFTNSVKVSAATSKQLTCLPSPQTCQVVELSPGQGMRLNPLSNSSLIATFTFELMSIGVRDYPSAAAATQARQTVSTAGQTLIPLYSSTALSTLRFDAGRDALVKHRAPRSNPGGASGSTGSTASSGSTGATGATGAGGLTGAEALPLGLMFRAGPLR